MATYTRSDFATPPGIAPNLLALFPTFPPVLFDVIAPSSWSALLMSHPTVLLTGGTITDPVLTLTDGSTLTLLGSFLVQRTIVGFPPALSGTLTISGTGFIRKSGTDVIETVTGASLPISTDPISWTYNTSTGTVTTGPIVVNAPTVDQLLEASDTVTGGMQNDTLMGFGGADVITGGPGTDSLVGGSGDDQYNVDTFADVIVELAGQGTDTVFSSDNYIFHPNVENVTLTGSGNFGVIGNELANLITGNSGGNGITGGLGNDTINSGAGADVLDGEGGDDAMSGGTGVDVYFVDSALDTVTEVVEAGVFDTIWTLVTTTLPADAEILILNGGLAINGTGNDGAADNNPNLMLGNNVANTLTTFGGDDIILGRDGNDTITTGAGSAAGVEIISGGVGADTLTSGGGHDFFTYENINEAGDTITDFGVAGNDLDILDLRPMFFPTFTNLGGVTNVTQAVASGHLTFTQAGANTQVFADANGGGNNNVLLATLNNTTAATVQILTLI